jgi:tRNA pseudouridine38-40 synthase
MRYFLYLQYNGGNYAGWQIQNNAITVQQKLNEALQVLLRMPIQTIGCGRTDTGVHARQFALHFDCDADLKSTSFLFSLNGLLPFDIVAYAIVPTHAEAHARFDADSRSYCYFLAQHKSAFINKAAWLFNISLDLESMNMAAEIMMGYEDFSCFSKSHTQTKTNHCKIKEALWKKQDGVIFFTITADRFLRGMVRAIVGTMIQVGQHKISLNDFKKIIEKRNRSNAGKSVPAHGLYLMQVTYPYITPIVPPPMTLPNIF